MQSSSAKKPTLLHKLNALCSFEDHVLAHALAKRNEISSSATDVKKKEPKDDYDDERAKKRLKMTSCESAIEPGNKYFEEQFHERYLNWNSIAEEFVSKNVLAPEKPLMSVGGGSDEEWKIFVAGEGVVANEIRKEFGVRVVNDLDYFNDASVMDSQFEERVWDQFVSSSDACRVCVAALETFEARMKIDRLCVKTKKRQIVEPFMSVVDCGIEDDRGSVFVVHGGKKTRTYSCMPRDLDESSLKKYEKAPSCVLENFPFQFSHACEWARNVFENVFVTEAQESSSAMDVETNNADANALALRKCRNTKEEEKFLVAATYFANKLFVELFQKKLNDIRENFPKDKDEGKFWNDEKGKRFPIPLVISSDIAEEGGEELNEAFLKTARALYMTNYFGIIPVDIEGQINKQHDDDLFKDTYTTPADFLGFLKKTEIQNIPIASDTRISAACDIKRFETFNGKRWDHALFVEACALLRAKTYRIDVPEYTYETHREVLFDLPKKNPVAGLVAAKIAKIEVIKLFTNNGVIRNSFFNVRTNDFVSAECPDAFVKLRKNEPDSASWTIWSVIDIDCSTEGRNTLGDFLRVFREEVGKKPECVGVGAALVYMEFMNKEKRALREKMSISDAIKDTVNKDLTFKIGSEDFVMLTVQAVDEKTGEDVELPDIRCKVSSIN